MPNGKPGDHPITDICLHGKDYFSPEVADLIRKIDKLGSSKEMERLVMDNFMREESEIDLENMKAQLEAILAREASRRS